VGLGTWDYEADGEVRDSDWVIPRLNEASNEVIEAGVSDDDGAPSRQIDEHDATCRMTYGELPHQLLGHPVIVHHGAMQLLLELGNYDARFELLSTRDESWGEGDQAQLARAYQRWRLLFQMGDISSAPALNNPSRIWADNGLMYFWIEAERLALREFSNVQLLGATAF
jgi:hypothetical protein